MAKSSTHATSVPDLETPLETVKGRMERAAEEVERGVVNNGERRWPGGGLVVIEGGVVGEGGKAAVNRVDGVDVEGRGLVEDDRFEV